MAPPHKFLHTRNITMNDDDFANATAPVHPPDLDDVLPVMYRRIRGYLQDSCLTAEQKRSAVANCVNRSAE